MDNEGLIKITGHPLILFGEKSKNLRKRRNYIKFFNKKYYLDKKWKLFRKENNLKKKFFKLESRKSIFQHKQTNKEIWLSKKVERCCLFYRTNENKDFKKKLDLCALYSKFTFHLIKKIFLNHNFSCFQACDIGLYSLKRPDKIFLYDYGKNKMIFTLNSKLYKLNYLSSNPVFPFCFLTSNQKCSEFWKISSSGSNPTFEPLYHKDLINFQKYRENGKKIDFGTLGMRWKCFDGAVQKYVFSRQFNETITNISTNEDNNLSAISTSTQIIIFDNRINKQISTLKLKNVQYSSIEWMFDNSTLLISDKKIDIWNIKQNKSPSLKNFDLTENNKWNFITESKFLVFKKKKKLALISEKLPNNVIQSIYTKNKIKSLCQNLSNTMLALNINNKVFLFQKR